MFTITCQYTGIEFEASSKRSKNHPAVAKFLDEASKDRFHVGAYAEAKRLVAQAKGKFESIDELMVAVTDAFNAWCDGEAQPKLRIAPKGYATRPNHAGELDELNDGIGGGQAGRAGFN